MILVPEKSRPRGNSSSKKAIAEKAIVAILETNNDLKYSALVNALPYESVEHCQRQCGAVKWLEVYFYSMKSKYS